jgi:hypothetical protein
MPTAARTMPKAAPNGAAPSALKQATIELENSVSLLNELRGGRAEKNADLERLDRVLERVNEAAEDLYTKYHSGAVQ